MRRVIDPFVFLVVMLVFAIGISAQDSFARYEAATRSVVFRVASVSADRIKRIALFDSASGNSSDIALSRINPVGTAALKFVLTPAEVPSSLQIYPVVLNIVIQPKPDESKRTVTSLTLAPMGNGGITATANDAPEGRDDADVYLSGEAILEHGEGPKLTLDVKLQKRYAVKDKPIRITPFVDGKITNDDGATDKLDGGVKFLFAKNKRHYTASGELETDHKFRVVNLLTKHELKYLPKAWRSKERPDAKLIAFPSVFVGAEVGRNLKTPVPRDGSAIARLVAGAGMTIRLNKPFKSVPVKKLIWDSKFQQRWFLANEEAYDTEDDEPILKSFGRHPRTHFSSDLHFMFNDFVGPSLKYEWGQLPPLYKNVQHRVTFGVTFSLVRKPAE